MGVRYFYSGMMFLALTMLRDKRLTIIYLVLALVFTRNILEIVWLGIGLLFYPYKLLFWGPVVDAIVMIVLYLTLMYLFLHPLLGAKARITVWPTRLLSEMRPGSAWLAR